MRPDAPSPPWLGPGPRRLHAAYQPSTRLPAASPSQGAPTKLWRSREVWLAGAAGAPAGPPRQGL